MTRWLWRQGESSGHRPRLVEAHPDRDGDALRLRGELRGTVPSQAAFLPLRAPGGQAVADRLGCRILRQACT